MVTQRERQEPERRPHRDPRDMRRLEPVPQRERDRPQAVHEQEHAPVMRVIIDPGRDAAREHERGDEAEEEVEEEGHVSVAQSRGHAVTQQLLQPRDRVTA